MHTEVLYLSSVASAAQFRHMKQRRRPGVQEVTYGMIESGHKFHTLIQQGLLAAGDVRITSLAGRPVTPDFYQGRWWPRVMERTGESLMVDHLGFPNLKGAKQAWLATAFFRGARQWERRTRGASRRVLVADASYVSALPAVLLALRGSDVRKVAIFADIYRYMAPVRDASETRRPADRVARALARSTYAQLDGFILLTEAMNGVVNPDGRPHLVMEGLADAAMADRENVLEAKEARPTVMYAGALRAEYGLADLVEGFRNWSCPEARLSIYGNGDYVPAIVAASQEDARIHYAGTVPVSEVVAAEERAWLLVNPRPADQEFTRYSFPSKVMEYLASGTPVLTTRLPGIPDEYWDYALAVEDPGPEGVRAGLARAFSGGLAPLHERGLRGKRFVLENKTNVHQAQRILAFAEGTK